jgi:anaerobic selenocysteine-containing dehydrogenase
LNPADAAGAQVEEGALVTVRSDQGNLKLTAKLDPQVRPGSAWIPEGLPGAPVGALLNGSEAVLVTVAK